MLAMTTDYAGVSRSSPEPYLKRIAAAGYSHLHWCHQWNTDFVYARPEIDQIARWLRTYRLQLLDLHASHGSEKAWASAVEYERRAGVELVRNRLAMTARLGGRAIVMHVPHPPDHDGRCGRSLDPVRRSLDTLAAPVRRLGVRIAIENGCFACIGTLLSEYPPDVLGICYDSGHGNCQGGGTGLDALDRVKDRLVALHLHDNDGSADQHRPPFTGTVDWPRLAGIIAASSYAGCISMESSMKAWPVRDEDAFLSVCFEAGSRLRTMVERARQRR